MFSNLFTKVASAFSISAETQEGFSFRNAGNHALKATILTFETIGHISTSCSMFLQDDTKTFQANKELAKALSTSIQVAYHATVAAATLGAVLLDGAAAIAEKVGPMIYDASLSGMSMISNQFSEDKEEGYSHFLELADESFSSPYAYENEDLEVFGESQPVDIDLT